MEANPTFDESALHASPVSNLPTGVRADAVPIPVSSPDVDLLAIEDMDGSHGTPRSAQSTGMEMEAADWDDENLDDLFR